MRKMLLNLRTAGRSISILELKGGTRFVAGEFMRGRPRRRSVDCCPVACSVQPAPRFST
ncbi:MAG: hypothetical protein ABFC96_10395 [Thermoguttaceae bacterium]